MIKLTRIFYLLPLVSLLRAYTGYLVAYSLSQHLFVIECGSHTRDSISRNNAFIVEREIYYIAKRLKQYVTAIYSQSRRSTYIHRVWFIWLIKEIKNTLCHKIIHIGLSEKFLLFHKMIIDEQQFLFYIISLNLFRYVSIIMLVHNFLIKRKKLFGRPNTHVLLLLQLLFVYF